MKGHVKYGEKDEVVGRLQHCLNNLGLAPEIKVDDDFGPATRRALLLTREDLVRETRLYDPEMVIMENLVRLKTGLEREAAAARADGTFPPLPRTYAEIGEVFGTFDATPKKGEKGWVKPTNKSKEYRIVKAKLPIVGNKWVHEKIVPVLARFLEVVEDEGLADDLRGIGTYACRHIGRNPKRRLSIHSWGIAFDVDSGDNRMGKRGLINPRIRIIAEALGFHWGGRWGVSSADRKRGLTGNQILNLRGGFGAGKDDMHFEYYLGNSSQQK